MAKHLVHSQKIHVSTDAKEEVQELQIQIRNFCNDTLPAIYQSVFDEVAPQKTLRIEKLHIDLGAFAVADWVSKIKEELESKLRNQLEEIILNKKLFDHQPTAAVEIANSDSELINKLLKHPQFINVDVNVLESYRTLAHYVEYGIKPWFISPASTFKPKEIVYTLIEGDKTLFNIFLQEIEKTNLNFSRLIQLIPKADFFHKYHLFNQEKEFLSLFEQNLNAHEYHFFLTLWFKNFTILRPSVHQNDFKEWFVELNKQVLAFNEFSSALLERIIEQKASSFLIKKVAECIVHNSQKNTKSVKKELAENIKSDILATKTDLLKNSILLENAGLVLVWPFLSQMFAQLNWLENQQFKNKETLQKAVVWLHYLVFNHIPEDESLLLLNKILCGCPIDEVITFDEIFLTKEETVAIEDFKKKILYSWPQLKTTMTESLNDNFFNRTGMLTSKREDWIVKVERKGIDVLIDRLPWPLSQIKLPWNNYLIQVNW